MVGLEFLALTDATVTHANEIIVPAANGAVKIGGGPVTSEGQAIPTCGVCEKVLIEKMREKHSWFNIGYALGHAFMRAWMILKLSKDERSGEEDNAVRACRSCEKVYLRRLRAKSERFNRFYKPLDGALEGMLDKMLDDQDREEAFNKDPAHVAHARALMKFNPRSYHMGEDFIVGIKFDGCIAKEPNNGDFNPDYIGEPVEGIKEKLRDLRDRSVKVVVYGWRSNEHTRGNPHYRKEAEKWFKANNIPYNFFHDGKYPLVADVFISQRVPSGNLTESYARIIELATDPSKAYIKKRHIV